MMADSQNMTQSPGAVEPVPQAPQGGFLASIVDIFVDPVQGVRAHRRGAHVVETVHSRERRDDDHELPHASVATEADRAQPAGPERGAAPEGGRGVRQVRAADAHHGADRAHHHLPHRGGRRAPRHQHHELAIELQEDPEPHLVLRHHHDCRADHRHGRPQDARGREHRIGGGSEVQPEPRSAPGRRERVCSPRCSRASAFSRYGTTSCSSSVSPRSSRSRGRRRSFPCFRFGSSAFS